MTEENLQSRSMSQPSNPTGPTGMLCSWLRRIALKDVPTPIQTRAKYLILDGIGCALVGAHLPWSETAVNAMLNMEPEEVSGRGCSIVGWERRVGPLAAALLNSTFIQGFELDDYHSEAPLHSNAIVLPAIIAAAEHERPKVIDGEKFLLAAIVGYEVGPRVGLGLYGTNILSLGWHSGSVFGPAAAAASVSKLLELEAGTVEDAMGIACTQACGLMSAQYGSMVKRMHHGFAARNGLFAVLMARDGYTGIQQVFEQPWGGFLSTFGQGSGRDPLYRKEEIASQLGECWQIEKIRVKPYAALAVTHATIDCIRELQRQYPEKLKQAQYISSITIEMSEPAMQRGGWLAQRPITVTGAQMNVAYIAALQLVDGEVLLAQFQESLLNRDILWNIMGKTTCKAVSEFDGKNKWNQRVTISVHDSTLPLIRMVRTPKGLDPAMSNEEILTKWRRMMDGVIDHETRDRIESMILDLENIADVTDIGLAVARSTRFRL